MRQLDRLQLVVLDWAGTTIDHGCFAPVAPFIESFAAVGVTISVDQARAPMGLHKKDHIRAILQTPPVAQQFRARHGRDWSEQDVSDIFIDHFTPAQLDAVQHHSRLVPGLLDCIERLRARQLKIGTTTGYFREAAERAYAAAAEQGYRPDCNLRPDDVPAARPAPWMIFRIMEALDVYPPAAVVKVGDTAPDIAEGRNAGVWSVGVTHTGSFVGCTAEELAALSNRERDARVANAQKKLLDAGAHFVIGTVVDLPELIERIDKKLQQGERP